MNIAKHINYLSLTPNHRLALMSLAQDLKNLDRLPVEQINKKIDRLKTYRRKVGKKNISLVDSTIYVLKKIKHQEQPKTEDLKVSDHALVRYMERIKGFDVNAMKREVANKANQECKAIIRNGKIKTVWSFE